MSVVVYLNGGPCNGTDKVLTDAEYASRETTCKSTLYKYDSAAGKGFELPVFSSADTFGKPAPSPAGIKAPQAHGGWASMRHAVNVSMVRTLKQSQANNDAAFRKLSKARKVRM